MAPGTDSRMQDWKADILMVDDEPGNLLALEALLEPLGQNLLRAPSGEEALRLMLRHDPAVVLLDVRMPGMDGFETARLIRQRERSRRTPVIFLTGEAGEVQSALRGYDTGAVDYLVKPLVPAVLRSKVAVFVELHRKNVELTREIEERNVAQAQLRESELQLRALAARLISIREEERARIAREIHDELGQVLTGLKMDATWLARRLAGTEEQLVEKAEAMCRLIDSTMHLIRRISTGLRPEILDDMGLVAAFGWQAREFQKRMGIRCHLRLPQDEVVLDQELSTAVFRIFQEILTNIARHAKASRVDVSLGVSGDLLQLSVADDGIGISQKLMHGQRSLGLLGMQERAQLFGGEVSIRGAPHRGTTVSVSIPMSHRGAGTQEPAPHPAV
jgi:signal transduction histidine kinase